jgi:hypothetical protein
LCFLSFQLSAQVSQIDISRIQQMPNMPAPYLMRDWKATAISYDAFVFATGATGEHLPLIRLKPSGINYPSLQPIYLDTYVGSSTTGNQAEAINIIPALVGSTLVGINKSNQNGINWVIKAKDFFNKANEQNVYLNSYSINSGHDWWYDLMPNVYFYQLYSQYPSQIDFAGQVTTIADRWLAAVEAMGGSATPWAVPYMNHRAWYLEDMTPNDDGVKEPESAGVISWLLYHAYTQSGDRKYLYGAQQAMEFLAGQSSNPSYELQLPYGTFMAAKMNADLGTHYDVEKMINWSFDKGPLRNWGAIVGTWNGSDVSGLIGEANDAGNDYAFVMNGFQQAAALVPLVKYDKRFARSIAKWVLNVANASRLFYSPYLPSTSQDNFGWSSVNDPQSVVAYEALKENLGGKHLYATGDAMNGGWAQTNLSIYSSSSVGYLAALIDRTDVDGILLLDVNKTDFFGQNTFPSFLVYNPYASDKLTTLALGSSVYDIYDAVGETTIKSGVTGNTSINTKANEAMLLVYLPAGSNPVDVGGKLQIGNDVVDYHYGYHFEGELRIKSLTVLDTLVEFDQVVPIYASVENITEAVTYNWYVNGSISSSSENFSWNVSEVEGLHKILLEVTSGSSTVKDSIYLTVVDRIPLPPVIEGFTTDKSWYSISDVSVITCDAGNSDGAIYTWTSADGTMINQEGSLVRWKFPSAEGVYSILCEVTNADGLKASAHTEILVKVGSSGETTPLAYFPLDGDALDYSGNERHATLSGAQSAADARGEPGKAYQFAIGSDIIFVPNESALNFQDQITVAFWVFLDGITQEAFIISHGSWEERWKVSVTPDSKLRWTVKTSSGTKDLDSSYPVALHQFYHVAVVYSGYSMELYINGELDAFLSTSGSMTTTSKDITFGRKDGVTTNYGLKGILDEVRIYDQALTPGEIHTLKSIWNMVVSVSTKAGSGVNIYPNPTTGIIHIESPLAIERVELRDATGRQIDVQVIDGIGETDVMLGIDLFIKGMVILKVEVGGEVKRFKVVVE